MAARHEQPVTFPAAKADIGAAFRQGDVPDSLALRVEHPHAIEFFQVGLGVTVAAPAAPEVAAFVALDAIDGGVVQALDVLAPLAQGAVVLDRDRPDQAVGLGPAFDHVEDFLVRGKAQPVRPRQVVDHPAERTCLAIDAVHRMGLGRRDFVPFVVVAGLERRVGEPDRTVLLADDVVGRVERLALETVRQHGDRAVVLGAGHAPAFAGRGGTFAHQQSSLAIPAHAVGEVGVFAVHREIAGDFIPAHDAVVGNVTDQQVTTVADPHRPFRPAQAGGELFHAGVEDAQVHEARVEDIDQRVRVTLAQRFGLGEPRQVAQGSGSRRNHQGFFQEDPTPLIGGG
ncbi:hypothetical protein PHLH5_19750 [Pseudomonas sp. Cab53]|nr:hypothetical protein PHLH5_19750 [Pseudomonas sp. Cab53]